MPGRSGARNYPIAATATAPALETEQEVAPQVWPTSRAAATAQPALFDAAPEPRVIPFNLLTSPKERQAIEARAAGLAQARAAGTQPAEGSRSSRRQTKVQSPPGPAARNPAPARAPRPRPANQNQQTFHFATESELAAPPAPVIVCDALAAPPAVRFEAALIDASYTAMALALAFAPVLIWARPLVLNQWTLGWLGAIVAAVVIGYRLIWIICGRDSLGARRMGLSLTSLDGAPPSVATRYRRLLATAVSISAAGVGLVWALFDEDHLAWHDHMSGTFPTIADE